MWAPHLLRQRPACQDSCGGLGGRDRTREEEPRVRSAPWRSGGLPLTVPVTPLKPLRVLPAPTLLRSAGPGTHVPQAEVSRRPVIRPLPVPAGAGRVERPAVRLPACGRHRAGLSGQPRLLQRLWGGWLGGQNQTWGAVRVCRQPLVGRQFTCVQGDALQRSKEKEGRLPFSAAPKGTLRTSTLGSRTTLSTNLTPNAPADPLGPGAAPQHCLSKRNDWARLT